MPNIIEITDLSDPALAPYFRLTEAQLRNKRNPEEGIFIAESHKVIGHALDAGCVPLSFLMERRQIEGVSGTLLERCPDTPVYTADREMLCRLTGYELTRGCLCAMRRPATVPVEEVVGNARRIAVLDGIADAANVGAILRSAAALHMDAILLSPSCCDPLHRRAVRVSMGTVFQIPWARLEKNWPEHLRGLGIKTAALALTDRSVSVDDAALAAEPRIALVLGSEGDGLSETVIESCDYTVKIPMSHGVDSLNVAAAAAVAFWELRIR
jgi:tRNA G18 (ribose-2'-O)-methylase SpoU